MKSNKIALLLILLVLSAAAQARPETTSDSQTANDGAPMPETQGKQPRRLGYGVGYEYRVRHGMETRSHERAERPERPEHPPHADRPERHERPERPDHPDHPGHR